MTLPPRPDARKAAEMQPVTNASPEEPSSRSGQLQGDAPATSIQLKLDQPQVLVDPGAQTENAPRKCCKCNFQGCGASMSTCCLLYIAAAPATEQNNCCLACGNCLFPGLCMALAGVVDCGSRYQRKDLCIAGWAEFVTAFAGIGWIFAILQSIAIMREDGVW